MDRKLIKTELEKVFFQTSEPTGLARRFLDPKHLVKRFLVGRNNDSLQLIAHVKIDAVVDDFSIQNEWHGIPIIKFSQIPEGAIIVNCSSSVSPISVQRLVEKLENTFSVWFYQLVAASNGGLKCSDFVSDMRASYQVERAKWNWLLEQMADDESAKTLCEVMLFRLTGNPDFMRRHSVRITEQYFEPFLGSRVDSFVDVGGFDGDTTEQFAIQYPNYQSVFFFEPSLINLEKAKARLKHLKNIRFFQIGASNESTTLKFSDGLGSASVIDSKGAESIQVARLDEVISEKIDWIKMDIEGWELRALEGSAELVKKYHPRLAIAVYHHASDFLRIPEFIKSVCQDYDIFLRHYTEGWSETIMYFIPKENRK
jgi:FkbM family methyltransferase